LPTAVAIRLPPLPAYHSAKMDLRAEIDRGEVVLARPKLDKEGHKKWHPPVSDRPTLTLYARVGKGEVALGRWPTTIGGWKTIEKSDGSMALKYKESVTVNCGKGQAERGGRGRADLGPILGPFSLLPKWEHASVGPYNPNARDCQEHLAGLLGEVSRCRGLPQGMVLRGDQSQLANHG
jgi:hypothetical protein